MKRLLLACGMALSLPVLAQDDVQVLLEPNGMDIEVKRLGVAEADISSETAGVLAVRVINHSNEIASCQFHAEPEETVMTAAPAFSVNPNEEAVMRVPGKYSAGGPIALLVCRPEGVPELPTPAGPGL